jgi:murein L,D-transpeptidase YcbB/YkuD
MLAMDVVVGGAFNKQTPVFAADMKYLIFRPYWEVPVSIMRAELGPKALTDPEFMQREGRTATCTSTSTSTAWTRSWMDCSGRATPIQNDRGPVTWVRHG